MIRRCEREIGGRVAEQLTDSSNRSRIWQPASVAEDISRGPDRVSPSGAQTNGSGGGGGGNSTSSLDLRAPQTQISDLPLLSPVSPGDNEMDMDMVM